MKRGATADAGGPAGVPSPLRLALPNNENAGPVPRPPSPAMRSRKGRRRRLRTTREGKAFIAVTLGVGVAAFNTGNNLMFLILGFMLSLIVLSGILSELVLQRIDIIRRLPRRAHAGEVALIEIALRNRKARVPSYSLEVEDQAADLPTERRCYFLKIAPQVEQVAAYRRTPTRRGYMHLTGFRVATRYPFGIFEKWRIIDSPDQLLVYPMLVRTPDQVVSFPSQGADAPVNRIGIGAEVAGLRAYRDGDEARAIHWKRSAALGRLVALERSADANNQLCLMLDNACPDPEDQGWAAGFEYAVSQAAAIAVDSLGKGLSVEVLCRGSRSALAHSGTSVEPVLQFLALLPAVPATEAPPFVESRARRAGVVRIPVVPRKDLA